MKKVIYSVLVSGALAFAGASVFTSCGSGASTETEQSADEDQPAADTEEAADTEANEDAVAYACPMHPEETGKEGDKCSKCGMDLEPVSEAETDTTAVNE